ncbi:ABC transporter permease [Nocardioides nematodiphilus]|uniref:ABC transporter permease n=1 Tax=Nocardioides nematodiphilus TaxID=2849669 RepID=UPI001CDA0484|nr:ABC transporter permease [Nocardioides nematodiphilus]MCA1984811.1 ABC transporter permease [Nocardioides nematodiphilus]
MRLSAGLRRFVGGWTILVLLFLYIPLVFVVLNSFNSSRTFAFPPSGLTLSWWKAAAHNSAAWHALGATAIVGVCAASLALVLGTCAAFALQRYPVWGKQPISLLITMPITLPGIVTGIAMNTTFHSVLGWNLTLFTVIIAHTTFCIVVVFNNVQARLRRTGTNLQEASSDLGATAFQTFRWVTFPQLRGALLAGGLLAFALSFDEIVVTEFTAGSTRTLPLWIFDNLFRPNQAPVINVVAAVLTVIAVVPVWIAQRYGDDEA